MAADCPVCFQTDALPGLLLSVLLYKWVSKHCVISLSSLLLHVFEAERAWSQTSLCFWQNNFFCAIIYKAVHVCLSMAALSMQLLQKSASSILYLGTKNTSSSEVGYHTGGKLQQEWKWRSPNYVCEWPWSSDSWSHRRAYVRERLVVFYDPIDCFHTVCAGSCIQVDRDSHHLPVMLVHLPLNLSTNSHLQRSSALL